MEVSKWDRRFVDMARVVASWSKDPSTKVGAVITRPDKTIASMGYNGFPRGLEDDVERYADRSYKYPRVVHAEANAIVHATENLTGYTLYLWPLAPCCNCTGLIIQAGIDTVVWPTDGTAIEHWSDDLQIALSMLDEAGVGVRTLEPDS